MSSNHRAAVKLRSLCNRLVNPLVLISCASFLLSPTAHAGFFDQLKQATQDIQQIKHTVGNLPGTHPAPTGPQPATSTYNQSSQQTSSTSSSSLQPTTSANSQNATPTRSTSKQSASAKQNESNMLFNIPKIPYNSVCAKSGVEGYYNCHIKLLKTADFIIQKYPGIALNNDGLKLGMGVADVYKHLAIYSHTKPTVISEKMHSSYKTITMSSQAFVMRMSASDGPRDSIMVHFGSPATEDRVVEIDRTIEFDNPSKAPTISQIKAALYKKYGPSTKTPFPKEKYGGVINWIFGKYHLRSICLHASDDYCDSAFATSQGGLYGYSSMSFRLNSPLLWLHRSISLGNYVVIEAQLSSFYENRTRIHKLTIMLSNQRNAALSEGQDLAQLHAAAVAAFNKNATPAAAPTL